MCSASGILAPPMILFKYKRMPQKIAHSVPQDWGVGITDSGSMTGESFFEYITNIFYPWLIKENVEFPIILFVDGHTSHLTLKLSEFCSQNKITLVALLPNATHILQSLDVAFFRPFKQQWKAKVFEWRMQNNGQKLSRDEFGVLLEKTLLSMNGTDNILKNGFRTCGIYPFNSKSIDYNRYFKTTESSGHTLHESTAEITEDNDGTEKYKQFLGFLEKDIPDKIDLFQQCTTEWTGNVEDKSLFCLWKNVSQKASRSIDISTNTGELIDEVLKEGNVSFNADDANNFFIDLDEEEFVLLSNNVQNCTPSKTPMNNNELIVININNSTLYNGALSSNDLNTVKQDEHNSEQMNNVTIEHTNPQVTPEPPATISEENEDNKNTLQEQDFNKIKESESAQVAEPCNNQQHEDAPELPQVQVQDLSGVPTPFKRCLFWPGPQPQKSNIKTKKKIHSVASSERWQEYHKKLQDEKDKKDADKERRKADREAKKKLKSDAKEGDQNKIENKRQKNVLK
ncbi:hypothetical protein PPYR_02621 [Photinus pyralis]|uniref:DDE-1 domain-containing protein n=1 Tax=Photinus pyralis TaxID=7054 RepID=A0A5N4B7Q6_PHOPY|nr:uncharacterized protein LOC116160162 [Photinus pyralis]XP_031329264.1 uncharacterized protein LOC116160162 [Photinus pyralis]KAB0805651.1 hypothetical protein PPYR_02621 [Photinus pyralis]